LGASSLAQTHPSLGPACHESVMTGSREMPHVVQISFFNDPLRRSAAQLLSAWPTLVDVAEAAANSGSDVSLVQASSQTEHFERNGVHYHFLPFDADPMRGGEFGADSRGLLRSLAADVFHVHGLDSPRQVLSLSELNCGAPIILQDHASRPPRIWRRSAARRGMSVAAGVAFCSLEQARPFINAGLIGTSTQVYEIPESTSRFAPADRDEARRLCGVQGDPAVLWVGHLDANKDPLTVLEGISAAIRELPQLRLYCCFGTAPLRRAVQSRIASDTHLRDRVHLLGRLPHESIEQLMRAADIFVLGSHREGSGYSLIEALACGLPPVVTDIPSFRTLTRAGSIGELWPCGDSHALCQALLSIARRPRSEMRATVRTHFERELSFEALGVKLLAMYQDVLARKSIVSSPDAARIQAAS
jgi:glycosyltransferase involved in cell wall biosynthesis